LCPEHIAILRDLPILSPAMTWTTLAEILDPPDLLAAADYIVTGRPFDRIPPLASLDELATAVEDRTKSRGARRCRDVLPLVRVGPLSRPESLVRLIAARAGVPEPVVNVEAWPGGPIPDLAWPEFKVAVEYEGDHHREKQQFRADIGRIELLIDDDWLMVKASADDVFVRPRELAARIGRRLATRGWSGTVDLRRIGHFRR
jgi:hypothetical protein